MQAGLRAPKDQGETALRQAEAERPRRQAREEIDTAPETITMINNLIVRRIALGQALFVLACATVALVGARPAVAATPWWHVIASTRPTNLTPGGEGEIVVLVSNVGDAPSTEPITVSDSLPAGLTVQSVSFMALPTGEFQLGFLCETVSSDVTCSFPASTETPLEPYDFMEVIITVKVPDQPGEGRSSNTVRVTGGGAPATTTTRPVALSSGPTAFGVEDYGLTLENEGGSSDTQAGSHPFQLTSTLALDQTADPRKPPAAAKDMRFELPSGLIGNPNAVPQCTAVEFDSPRRDGDNECPPDTAIGVASVTLSTTAVGTAVVPVFNLTPGAGEPARFGFLAEGSPVTLDTSVRTGGNYGVTVSVNNISEFPAVISAQVTLWGVPSDPRHDSSRGWDCVAGGHDHFEGNPPCTPLDQAHPLPFLMLPTACTGSLQTTVQIDSWAQPGSFLGPIPSDEPIQGLSGCNRLNLEPTIVVAPERGASSTPTGLNVDVHVPQEETLNPEGLAQADVKDTTLALPEGMQLSPSSANGLEACSEGTPGGVGFTGFEEFEARSPTATFIKTLPEEWESGKDFCANGSKVGVVHIKTPLLSHEVEGGVYLAAQNANPFGSLVALYIVAKDPVSGVIVKLAGEVHLNEHTGQIITTFNNTPQLPFEDFKVELFGGPAGPVSTPPSCGTYTATASFTPWSGKTPVGASSSMPINSGPSSSPCSNPQPFSPSLTAGSTDIQAGAFTPLTLTMSREDGNQNLDGVELHLPEGLLGMLSSVTPCPEPAAAEGTCGPESLIGHTVASVGLGPDPYTISGGQVFITGPYKGAPYGLSIAQPAKAGPFDLGSGHCDCVVVRAKIEVDPHTSALTITSDPLPTILDGIPVQLKRVTVTADRTGFTFNPTNCSPLHITATLTSEQGATAGESVPFEVANCATLPFKPTFTVLTDAHTSKEDGAYLHVKVTSGPGQANIGMVKTDLPLALPSRLTTLQKACPAQTFEANPALCPSASVVGEGVAVTPVLKNALRGPAYLVSHAAAAFPDLEIVLQGEGITLVLDGTTDIKKGITSSAFRSVPDAPISSFNLVLPEGPHSALAANGDLCTEKLDMPTKITGQNGAVVQQTTRIAVEGCRGVKGFKARKHKKSNKRKRGGEGGARKRR
jgi:uncharacterized repeat protein (TIGR01451 family)